MRVFRSAVMVLLLSGALSAPAAFASGLVNLLGVPAPAANSASQGAGNPEIERLLVQPADLWERIRLGFAMPNLDHPLVAVHEAWYADHRPEQLRTIFTRARRYLHFIVEEVERRGMPLEIALLPVVESGFNPMALSAAQASGLWQFIPATAARYQLAQTPRYDARRDIVASTRAALDYLQFLHRFTGDWHLALAAYNWGEQAVARAVERAKARGGGADFGALALPEETRHYVPRLQAVKNMVANPEKYGLDLGAMPNESYFTVVPVRDELPLALAARLAGLAQEELVALNPGWTLPRIPGSATPGLVLPAEHAEAFREGLERWRALNGTRSQRAAVPRKSSARD